MTCSRVYTWIAACGLMLQGTTTLAARLVPAIDEAFPALLQQTQMIPSHSLLHIASAVAGFWCLRLGPPWPWRFAMGFGLFYFVLAFAGMGMHHQFGLGLQPFDHPFHAVLGGAGVLCALVDLLFGRASATKGTQP